ncbi:hypothetical protein KM92DES2_11639 [uncultured Desulfovibrio sp.]|uniref:Uncharacterized protein n=1 Tax=uncultured Desulfovibrio sp. TaxID=167968 RepID=A0A212JSA1_9BACT|nr:hypothetical protein KM92DES2_11639 [uncultured Desulfovibrio sp.]
MRAGGWRQYQRLLRCGQQRRKALDEADIFPPAVSVFGPECGSGLDFADQRAYEYPLILTGLAPGGNHGT